MPRRGQSAAVKQSKRGGASPVAAQPFNDTDWVDNTYECVKRIAGVHTPITLRCTSVNCTWTIQNGKYVKFQYNKNQSGNAIAPQIVGSQDIDQLYIEYAYSKFLEQYGPQAPRCMRSFVLVEDIFAVPEHTLRAFPSPLQPAPMYEGVVHMFDLLRCQNLTAVPRSYAIDDSLVASVMSTACTSAMAMTQMFVCCDQLLAVNLVQNTARLMGVPPQKILTGREFLDMSENALAIFLDNVAHVCSATKFTHNDLHPGNVICSYDANADSIVLRLIDYGRCRTFANSDDLQRFGQKGYFYAKRGRADPQIVKNKLTEPSPVRAGPYHPGMPTDLQPYGILFDLMILAYKMWRTVVRPIADTRQVWDPIRTHILLRRIKRQDMSGYIRGIVHDDSATPYIIIPLKQDWYDTHGPNMSGSTLCAHMLVFAYFVRCCSLLRPQMFIGSNGFPTKFWCNVNPVTGEVSGESQNYSPFFTHVCVMERGLLDTAFFHGGQVKTRMLTEVVSQPGFVNNFVTLAQNLNIVKDAAMLGGAGKGGNYMNEAQQQQQPSPSTLEESAAFHEKLVSALKEANIDVFSSPRESREVYTRVMEEFNPTEKDKKTKTTR